jgi:hypothetical protein
VTGEPWWGTQVREDERIPGGHSVALSKTRVGQQRFREAMLGRYGESCAFTAPSRLGRWKPRIFTSTAKIPSMISKEACCFDATCTHCLIDG